MIVVTGAAGFLGSNLVLALNGQGVDDVLCVDPLDETAKHRNLNRARFVDLIDPESLVDGSWDAPSIEAVVHFGACVDTTQRNADLMMDRNYRYSCRLARWCFERRIPLVYASSATVYGRGGNGFEERHDCEDPLHLYGFTKLLFDQWARRHFDSQRVVGLRFFNVYGPQEQHKGRMASALWKFREQVRAARAIQLFEGSESFRRDFVYVDDAMAVTLFFLEHPDRSGLYNVGTGSARSFVELAELVGQRYDAQLRRIPFPEALRGRYQVFTRAELGALRQAGYEAAFTKLEDGVHRYLDIVDQTGGYRIP